MPAVSAPATTRPAAEDPTSIPGRIAVLLPDDAPGSRWAATDRPAFERCLIGAGAVFSLYSAGGDPATQAAQAAEAIDAGEPAPLASALIGPRLEAARVAIDPTLATPTDTSSEPGSTNLPGSPPGVEEPAGTPPTPGQRVNLKEAKVTIVRTSDSPQALPSLAVLADGTADDVEFSSAFVMPKPGDSYLLVDVVDPTTLPGS